MFTIAEMLMIATMIEWYNSVAYAHDYIFGYVEDGIVYAVFMNWNQFRILLKPDRTSSKKGGMLQVRIRATKKEIQAFKHKAIAIGRANELVTSDEKNKGFNFERLVVERIAKQTWKKSGAGLERFDKNCDVTINGIGYNVKLDRAALTTQKQYDIMIGL